MSTLNDKFIGMAALDAMRLRTLEAENAKLKKLLAESVLDAAVWIGIES